MLTSLGQNGDAARLKAAGIATCLVKPVRQSQLMDALATAWASHAGTEPARRPAPEAHARTAPRRHTRALVVDDNVTNQKVASLMLEDLNARVDLAANGREAIEMIELLPYDIVFMDCEMPEMDGFEATAEIRKRHAGQRRIPIIAVTAKAMQGDRGRCLTAGMDDYVSKPLMMEELETALDRWTAPPALSPEAIGRLRKMARNDAQVRSLFATFFADAEDRVKILRQAVASQDARMLYQAAHALRGGALNFGAQAVADLAERLEGPESSGWLDGAGGLVDELVRALEAVQLAVNAEFVPDQT